MAYYQQILTNNYSPSKLIHNFTGGGIPMTRQHTFPFNEMNLLRIATNGDVLAYDPVFFAASFSLWKSNGFVFQWLPSGEFDTDGDQ